MGPEVPLTTLGERLYYVRKHLLGWSSRRAQEELKRAGIDIDSHSTVLRYESGERIPGADYIAELCNRSNISADWLLTGEGLRYRQRADGADPYRQGAQHAIEEIFRRLLDIVDEVAIDWPTAKVVAAERELKEKRGMQEMHKLRRTGTDDAA